MRPVFLLACLLVSALTAPVSAAEKPNFVFIIADDLGWADVGFHGGTAPTPHLDRLAREGVELTQHYVAPVCSPTRCGLLTGRYWSRFGVTTPTNSRALPWDTVTLARALQQAGYDTALTGKWHLGSLPEEGPRKFGFDHSYGSLAGGVGPWDHRYKQGPWTHTWHRNEKLISEEGHVTDLITDEAVEWLESRGEQPFFLYVPFTAVHLPIREPQPYLDRVPKTIQGDVPRQYAACIIHLDDSVGRIVETLDRLGKRENTLVVFTSDNGGSWAENNDTKYPADDYPQGKLPGNNEPLRGQKGQLYEGGIRVPTIANWPRKLEAGQMNAPAHIVDWMPTLCALAGCEQSKDLKWDGRNLWPWLTRSESPQPRTLYWAGPGFRTQAVRHGDWKLIVSGNAKQKSELFDLASDPSEKTDLSEKHPERAAELRQRLDEASASDRDAVAK